MSKYFGKLDICLNLQLSKEQEGFLSSNVYSLVLSYVTFLNDRLPEMTFAIYHEEEVVGVYYDGSRFILKNSKKMKR